METALMVFCALKTISLVQCQEISVPFYQSSAVSIPVFKGPSDGNNRDQTNLPLSTCRSDIVDINTILPKAKVDWGSLTVSGFSSGAAMADQFVVAYSNEVRGAGILAGVAYGQYYDNPLPEGILRFFTGPLPYSPVPAASASLNPLLPYPTVGQLKAQATRFAEAGKIDALLNLKGKKIFVYHGKLDTMVNHVHGHRISQFYTEFGADLATDLNHDSSHVMGTSYFPTALNTTCSLPFSFLALDGVDNCGYDLVFDMFSHIYGFDYVAPVSATAGPTGTFSAFNQSTLTASGDNVADFMDFVGYIYVPANCMEVGNRCKIHIALHGCFSNVYNNMVCNYFAINSGYLQVADANDVVIVFPQSAPVQGSLPSTRFTNGCWDFHSGVSKDYCLKTGAHLASIRKIAAKVAGVS